VKLTTDHIFFSALFLFAITLNFKINFLYFQQDSNMGCKTGSIIFTAIGLIVTFKSSTALNCIVGNSNEPDKIASKSCSTEWCYNSTTFEEKTGTYFQRYACGDRAHVMLPCPVHTDGLAGCKSSVNPKKTQCCCNTSECNSMSTVLTPNSLLVVLVSIAIFQIFL
jgi:hypothetical protein